MTDMVKGFGCRQAYESLCGDADPGPEVPWVGGDRQHRLRCRLEQQIVDQRIVLEGNVGDLDGQRNLGSHKGKAVRCAIRAAGARLFFLPKYSPDLNPIEQLFAKIKHCLRKAAKRTADAVCDAIGQILATLTAQECANYFINAGYDPT